MNINLVINGEAHDLVCEPHESLKTVLRRAGSTVSGLVLRRAKPAQPQSLLMAASFPPR